MVSDAFTLGNLAGEFDWSFLWNNFKVCFVLLVSKANKQIITVLQAIRNQLFKTTVLCSTIKIDTVYI